MCYFLINDKQHNSAICDAPADQMLYLIAEVGEKYNILIGIETSFELLCKKHKGEFNYK